MPREEIARHYAAAHVFVLPSYNEGMSVALLEAMASGLAVVVTPTGGTLELVEGTASLEKFLIGLTWHDSTIPLRGLAMDRSTVRRMGEASRLRACFIFVGFEPRTAIWKFWRVLSPEIKL